MQAPMQALASILTSAGWRTLAFAAGAFLCLFGWCLCRAAGANDDAVSDPDDGGEPRKETSP